MTFVQLGPFVAKWRRMRLTDEDLQALEAEVMGQPEGGDVMRGTGGVRKVRFEPPSWRRGKSGSSRVCYIVIAGTTCYLLTLFAKSDKQNLTAAERAEMKRLTDALRVAHRTE